MVVFFDLLILKEYGCRNIFFKKIKNCCICEKCKVYVFVYLVIIVWIKRVMFEKLSELRIF